ncbi:SGNH/GDSL hydrolase family protein [Devosia beringensis]|uniref:SGNH/GDSL hydrolase family protein n=1 Tax=Devosia beringensis TaxID=2657486 RepID=UPI00186B6FE2|nr:DUF459 domain-containing protein [Devosia beringensis]
MVRIVLALLMGLFVLVDVAPVLAQNNDTIQVAQGEKRRTLFDLLFGEEPSQPAPVQQPQRAPRQQAPATAAAPVAVAPQVEKAADATRLAVFGDSLAIDLSRALERRYAEDANLVVINKGISSSGFVRADFYDWNAALREEIAADSFDLAVMIIGINDRQELRIDGQALAPLSAGWAAAYQARLVDALEALRAARKPVIWVGLPPMEKAEYSAAISQIANIQRLASFAGGAEYLDIYEKFLGEDGKYSANGPDVNGQTARMRKDDGIHFAPAGSDKLAFYLSQTIRTLYRGGAVVSAVADPLLGTDAAAMLRPPYQGVGQMRLLEMAGTVIPISRAPARANDLLRAGSAGTGSGAFKLETLFDAPVGRVDAFGVGVDPAAQVLENAGER